MGESMAIEGATDAQAFEAYIEHFLAPTLKKGQVVVLDGLGAHRRERVRELIEARGAELLFLPSYSPDLNPIEEAFSKIKGLVRKVGARTREALVEAIERALAAVSRPKMRQAGLPTLAIGHRINLYEYRCQNVVEPEVTLVFTQVGAADDNLPLPDWVGSAVALVVEQDLCSVIGLDDALEVG
jgi:transposase